MFYEIFNFRYLNLLRSLFLGLRLFVFNVFFSYLIQELIGESLGSKNTEFTTIDFNSFIFVVIIAPIFETFIFQWLIIYQVYESYNKGNKKKVAILISSILFGLSHCYSFYYMIFTMIVGGVLAVSFCHFKEKTNWMSAIIYVSIIHATSNLLVFMLKLINAK